MEFGWALPNNQGVEDPREIVALARRAEDAGYASVWVSEHLFHASYVEARLGARPYHEPLTLLGAIATHTERVGLGTSVLVLPWHHPVRLAKVSTALDHLSGGRLVLGVGVGAARDEFAALGAHFESRGQVADETLGALRVLFSQEFPEWKGERYAFAGLRFSPRPLQQPHPPLWVGGNSPAAQRRALAHGDAWHPLGLAPAELAKPVAELRAAAAAGGRRRALQVGVRVVLRFESRRHDRPPAERRSCRGTREEIAEIVRAYSAAGATHLVLDPNTGDLARIRDDMARFREEVIPALR